LLPRAGRPATPRMASTQSRQQEAPGGAGESAWLRAEESDPRTRGTVGTPDHMPPEQANREWERADERVDVFAQRHDPDRLSSLSSLPPCWPRLEVGWCASHATRPTQTMRHKVTGHRYQGASTGR
jgi:hypothetical protein